MPESRTCPKCSGPMAHGRILRLNEYVARDQYMYVFAPDGDAAPDLSKVFSSKPLSKNRKALVAYCCENCGFTEFYGISVP